MSRNGSGTYTLPSGNPVVSGTLIEASWANTTLSDIATALTDSLSRSGQGGMTAALRLFDGTNTVPGLAWGSETTTGWYRAGAGDMRLVITGSQVIQYLSTGVAITGTLSASGNATVGGTLAVTGAMTLTANPTLSAGTANGVLYLNGSKVATSGSALTFDGGGTLGVTATNNVALNLTSTGGYSQLVLSGGSSANYITSDDPLSFYLAGSEGMRLTSTGLGIGTSSPTSGAKLDVNGQIIAQNGSTSSLGYAFRLALSSGMYLYDDGVGANVVLQANANNNQLYLQRTGNVGIGTSSPATKLHVSGSGSTEIRVSNTGISLNAAFAAGSAGVDFGTSTNHPIDFYTNSSLRMKLDTSGNLGLGVTPSAWGSLQSNIKAIQIGTWGGIWRDGNQGWMSMSNNAYWDNSSQVKYIGNYAAAWYQQTLTGQHLWFTAASGTAGNAISFTQAMTLDANGQLGIGTTSPQNILELKSAAPQTVFNGTTSNAALGLIFQSNGTQFSRITSNFATGEMRFLNGEPGQGGYSMTFYTSGTLSATVASNGAFIVGSSGTNRGVGNLSINPNTSAGAADITFNRNSTTSTSYVVGFQNAGSTVGYIAYNNTSTTYATSSDARLKENEAPADDAGAIVDSILIRKFDWKADGSHQRFGVIAQELQTVYPEAVAAPEDATKMMGVDYSKMVPLLVKEIQSLRARVTQLEGA